MLPTPARLPPRSPLLLPHLITLLRFLLRPTPLALRLISVVVSPIPLVANLGPFMASPSNRVRPTQRPTTGIPASSQGQPFADAPHPCPHSTPPRHPSYPRRACPGRDPGARVFRSRRHPAALSLRAVPTAPQTPPKCTPRRLKSFLEKTLTARETPNSAPRSRPANDPASRRRTAAARPRRARSASPSSPWLRSARPSAKAERARRSGT